MNLKFINAIAEGAGKTSVAIEMESSSDFFLIVEIDYVYAYDDAS